MNSKLGVALCIVWLSVTPKTTSAYTISTIISDGCHERITTDALRTVRNDFNIAAPLPLTNNEQALVDDLQFSPDDDLKDLGGVSLLLSVRDNDLKGRSSTDLTELAFVHGNPDFLDEHCIRQEDQDEPNGSVDAINDCLTFIRMRVQQALDGLDTTGVPDINNRISLPIHLSLRGGIDAPLPLYYVRIGQAMHAIQDSFTHTYRTADGMKITVVLNWIEAINGKLSEVRDGPAHASALDVCDDPDDLRKTRRELATQASVELLRTTLDSTKTASQKMVALDDLLDTYLSYSPGCTFANQWCDAPEKQYEDPKLGLFGCGVIKSPGDSGYLPGIFMIFTFIALVLIRFRGSAVKLTIVVLLISGIARADGETQSPNDEHAPPPPVTVPVTQPGPKDPSEAAWGAYLGTSGSVDKPAFAGQIGVRRRMSTHWTLGWDVEWNPWVSLNGPTPIRAGVANTYGTVIYRFPLAYEKFNLTTTVNLGASYLLIDLFGANKGSLGLYGAISPLGVEWKWSRLFFLIINPLSLSVPVPQIDGVPLTYPQYRFSVGIGILAG